MLLAMLLSLTWTGINAPPSPVGLVAQVQKVYRGSGDLSATFSQTFFDKLRGERPTESGLLWAKTDGRVRWSYRSPARKDFVYTGSAAYFYEPENAQVTIFESFEDSPLANSIRFLWGQGSILETFDVTACDDACQPDAKSQTSVLLTPKESLPSVERIQLAVDADGRVRRTVVFDPIGNRTDYRFDSIQFGTRLEDKKFAFRVPDGVNIIRATPE